MKQPGPRLRVAVTVGAASLAAVVAVASSTLRGGGRGAVREGIGVVEHRLVLTDAALCEVDGARRLRLSGETTLTTGAQLEAAVEAGQRTVLSFALQVAGGRFELEAPAEGEVLAGRYEVVVRFALETQPDALKEALGFWPARLEGRRALLLPPGLATRSAAKDELRALFEDVNRLDADRLAPTRELVAPLEARAAALESRLWLSDQKVAVKALRRALEQAGRPTFVRSAFERELLEAHQRAGL